MESHLDFLINFLPIAAGHLLLPPLSYFNGERCSNPLLHDFFQFLYSIIPREFLTRDFIYSLLTDKSRDHIDATAITHVFVHSSYEHMFGNLFAALKFAYPVYKEFGQSGLYFLFLSGGAVASIPTFLKSDQKTAFSKLIYDKVSIRSNGEGYSRWIPDKLVKNWNKSVSAPIARTFGEILPAIGCGSSGAVCALMGCDLALLSRDCFDTIISVKNQMDDDDSSSRSFFSFFSRSNTRIDKYGKIIPKNSNNNADNLYSYIQNKSRKLFSILCKLEFRSVWRFYSLIQSVQYCCNELNTIYPVGLGALRLSDSNFFEKASDLFFVGHAEHIQGTMYGVAFAYVFGVIWPSYQRRRLI